MVKKMVCRGSAAIKELMNLFRETDNVCQIRKGRLRSLGQVERRPEERTVKKVFENIPEGKGWLDDVESDLKKMGVIGWKK